MFKRTLAAVVTACLFFSTTIACTVCGVTPQDQTKVTKRTVNVNPLFYKEDSTGPSGGYGTAKITIETNKTGTPKVGFIEDEVAGTGAQWRASGWMAATMGPFLLGRDVTDFKYSFEMNGYIDGPSAGGLMTAGVLAALLGDDVKKDVTMTGTINPDGTIGPVGGIMYKIDGAKKAGKKTMLIPAGTRYEVDQTTEEAVDLIAKGKSKGITVKEVANIYEAYKGLTGNELPKPEGATLTKVELPASVDKKVKDRAVDWFQKYEDERTRYGGVVVGFDTSIEDDWVASADDMAAKADDYLGQGMTSAAYDQITGAYMYTTMAYNMKKAMQAYLAQGGVAGVDNYLSTIDPTGKKMNDAFDQLRKTKPGTLADTIVLADAFGRLSLASGLIVQAEDLLSRDAATPEEAVANILIATAYYSLASYGIDYALDSVKIGMGIGKAKPADKAAITQLSEALRKASEANIEYFDTIVLQDIADSENVSLDAVKYYFLTNELDYGFAVSANVGAQEMKDKLGNTEARAIGVLGNSLESFVLSSKLIAKYYSLGAETDDNGNVIGVTMEKAMINMLDFGEDSALENINSAKKADALPVMAIIAFDGGKVYREGTYEDKFTALQNFWAASLEGKMLSILAGMKVTRTTASGTSGTAKLLGD
ncbi:MAG: S16 family serine protease [Actinomycetota bacterium]